MKTFGKYSTKNTKKSENGALKTGKSSKNGKKEAELSLSDVFEKLSLSENTLGSHEKVKHVANAKSKTACNAVDKRGAGSIANNTAMENILLEEFLGTTATNFILNAALLKRLKRIMRDKSGAKKREIWNFFSLDCDSILKRFMGTINFIELPEIGEPMKINESNVHFSKRYFKRLTKRYLLKDSSLDEWVHLVCKGKLIA